MRFTTGQFAARTLTPPLGLRLPRDVIKRADQLIPKLQQTDLLAAVRLSRSVVLRLAVIRGLAVLEQEHGPR
jgi:hypothetical protein